MDKYEMYRRLQKVRDLQEQSASHTRLAREHLELSKIATQEADEAYAALAVHADILAEVETDLRRLQVQRKRVELQTQRNYENVMKRREAHLRRTPISQTDHMIILTFD